jgi:hypothetical protein
MDEPAYVFNLRRIDVRYEFDSVSEQKTVRKVVVFSETAHRTIYNLALLDKLPTGEESDMVVTNNADMPRVLATVIQIAADFLTRFPEVTLVFQGSDERRTRLYRYVLSREVEKLNRIFVVFGLTGEGVELFRANRPYAAYLIRKK